MKIASYSRKPGDLAQRKMPLKLVTKLEDQKGFDNIKLGNPDDAGCFWALVAGRVNGSTDLEFGVYTMRPGEYHPRHYHTHGSEIYYITKGRCWVTLNDEKVEAVSGTAIYIPAGTIHSVRTSPDEGMEMVYVFPFSDFHFAGTNWIEEEAAPNAAE